jgi:hypothetical protein
VKYDLLSETSKGKGRQLGAIEAAPLGDIIVWTLPRILSNVQLHSRTMRGHRSFMPLDIAYGSPNECGTEAGTKVIELHVGTPVKLILKTFQRRQSTIGDDRAYWPVISLSLRDRPTVIARQNSHDVIVVLAEDITNFRILRRGDSPVVFMEIVGRPPGVKTIRRSRHRSKNPVQSVRPKSMRVMQQQHELQNVRLVRGEANAPTLI